MTRLDSIKARLAKQLEAEASLNTRLDQAQAELNKVNTELTKLEKGIHQDQNILRAWGAADA